MQVEELREIAAQAATPTYTDISQAAGVVLAELTDDTTSLELGQAVAAVCAATGVQQAHDGRVELGPAVGEAEVRTAPVVRYAKVLHATRLAIARLAAQGVIVTVQQHGSDPARWGPLLGSGYTLPLHGGGAFQIPVGKVRIPWSFRLTPGITAIGAVPLLTVEKWVADVEPLVNERLQRVLGESLSAARHGAYMAAVILLGAVLEGAWYAVGEELQSHDPKLASALAADQTASVQGQVSALIRNLPRMKGAANTLEAFAGYVRMVRNYGIHSAAVDDVAAESAFTEQGCYSTIQSAHSHLVQLLAAARKVDPAVFPI